MNYVTWYCSGAPAETGYSFSCRIIAHFWGFCFCCWGFNVTAQLSLGFGGKMSDEGRDRSFKTHVKKTSGTLSELRRAHPCRKSCALCDITHNGHMIVLLSVLNFPPCAETRAYKKTLKPPPWTSINSLGNEKLTFNFWPCIVKVCCRCPGIQVSSRDVLNLNGGLEQVGVPKAPTVYNKGGWRYIT